MARSRLREAASALRAHIRSYPLLDQLYRVLVGLLGFIFIVVGLVLVPFPFPISGWVIVLFGLLILATEFSWARERLHWLRTTLSDWGHWLKRQPIWVRAAIGSLTALFVITVTYTALRAFGLPGWVSPEWVPNWLGLG